MKLYVRIRETEYKEVTMEDMELKWYSLERDSVVKAIAQNYISAGVISEAEAQKFLTHLELLDDKDLLAVLVESQVTKEQMGHGEVYLVDLRIIGSN